ncbi:MAG: permease-like cell division protein FtsX [bacterium]|nr:permease-like cell division protein FtsX [bacterium]
MAFITFKRILKAGYLSFFRNGWLSMATIIVMSLMLFVMGNLIFLGAFANTALSMFQSKIDITVYFNTEAEENQMFAIKKELEAIPEVKEVGYVSKDEAISDFRDRHKGNAFIASALDEIGTNPLEASLNIKADDPAHYAAISDFLVKKNYPIIDKINYFENKDVIDRLTAMAGSVRAAGAVVALVLAFVAILVTFNTIRLAIYTVREEIGIMRLVGATQWFIRGPFLVSGVLYGVSAAMLVTLFFFPIAWFLAPKIMLLLPTFDLFHYFLNNFFEFFIIMMGSSVILGVLSSAIAIRKYLRV